jgi:hypothetical protein
MITAKPVIIRVTQPLRNARAAVVDRDCLTGEAAIGLALTTSSKEMLTVSCSSRLVAICFILSDLGERSDNTLARISSPILDAGCALSFSRIITCKLQVIFYLSLLPDLPKTGNHKKGEPNSDIPKKNSRAHDENLAVLRKFGGALHCVEPSPRDQC